MADLKGTGDYERCFDPISYLRENWTLRGNDDASYMAKWVPFMLDNYHKLFTEIRGAIPERGRLLDIGTGAAVAQLISASSAFGQIFCTDLVEESRNELKKFLDTGVQYHGFDWTPHFKRIAQLEGLDSEQWPQLLKRVQEAVVGILPCDVRKSNPVDPIYFTPFDCVTCHGVFEAAANSPADWQSMLENCLSLLRPGGTWIQMCSCGCTNYSAGREFAVYNCSVNSVMKSLGDAGLTSMEMTVCRDPNWTDLNEYGQDYAMVVIKAVKPVSP